MQTKSKVDFISPEKHNSHMVSQLKPIESKQRCDNEAHVSITQPTIESKPTQICNR